MKTMTTNVMKKFLKKLPKDIENIIKDDIKDIFLFLFSKKCMDCNELLTKCKLCGKSACDDCTRLNRVCEHRGYENICTDCEYYLLNHMYILDALFLATLSSIGRERERKREREREKERERDI